MYNLLGLPHSTCDDVHTMGIGFRLYQPMWCEVLSLNLDGWVYSPRPWRVATCVGYMVVINIIYQWPPFQCRVQPAAWSTSWLDHMICMVPLPDFVMDANGMAISSDAVKGADSDGHRNSLSYRQRVCFSMVLYTSFFALVSSLAPWCAD